MKNIHVIPTDKPSRLYLGNNGNFIFGMMQTSIQSRNDDFINQHIYITSDEEIREGEYSLSKLGEIIKFHSGYDYRYYKKITLTTDTQLIKDGVQIIDDEFLNWFVKNPSCEEVEIDSTLLQPSYKYFRENILKNKNLYKIIIPDEITYH